VVEYRGGVELQVAAERLPRAWPAKIQARKPMPLGTQNTSPVISALGSPGPVRAPSLGVVGWCWLGHRLPIGWCYWDYPIVPISLYHGLGLLVHIPNPQDTPVQNEGMLTLQLQTERHRSNETSAFHRPTPTQPTRPQQEPEPPGLLPAGVKC
jgi:hypothetical protein